MMLSLTSVLLVDGRQLTGAGFAAFAATQPDTPGKLIVHALSYEHMEEAAYDLLGKVARRAGDAEVAAVASSIEAQERAMGDRVAGCFDRAAAASLASADARRIDQQLSRYLTDAHAIELQALVQVKRAPKIAGDPEIAAAFEKHIGETEKHERYVHDRLMAMSWKPVPQKDIAGRVSGIGFALFARFQPDTPAKLAGFAYAFEHLEVAAYKLLQHVAARVDDRETVRVADTILLEERAAAAKIHGLFEQALDASLQEAGVSV